MRESKIRPSLGAGDGKSVVRPVEAGLDGCVCITGSHADDTHMASVVGDDHPHIHVGLTDTHKRHTHTAINRDNDNDGNEKQRRAATTIIIIVIIVVVATRHLGSKQTVLFVVFRNGLCSGTKNRIEFR